jgi:hypothetical protein
VKWEDDVKQDARVIKCYYLKKQTESRNGWKQINEQTKTHEEL